MLVLGLFMLCISLLVDLLTGSLPIPISTVMSSLFHYDGSDEQVLVRVIRLPRAVIALMVGGCLAVAGALTQSLTRNPIAAPDILGIHQGAAFFIVIAMLFASSSHVMFYNFSAFIGSAVTALVVFSLGSMGREGMTPVKLVLAGAAVTIFLSSLTQGILVLNERSLDEMRFWLAGSTAGRDMQQFTASLPFMFIGLALSILLHRRISALSLGDDVATGLGQHVLWTKLLAFIAIVLLSGSSVSIAGPIAFISLAVPHMVRFFAGSDYRWLIIHSFIIGSSLLLLADAGSKLIIHPSEVPIGIMTVLFGAPVFMYLVRKRGFK
jgi:iron complex transport system permease protein